MNDDSHFLASPSLKHQRALEIPLVSGSRKAIEYLHRCLFQGGSYSTVLLEIVFLFIHHATLVLNLAEASDSFAYPGILDRVAD